MVSKESVVNLVASMEGEIACLEEYIAGQKTFAAALREREWMALQAAMDGLEALSRKLAAFDLGLGDARGNGIPDAGRRYAGVSGEHGAQPLSVLCRCHSWPRTRRGRMVRQTRAR